MKKYSFALLGLVIFLGTMLRFYMLGSIPNSLDWDEVSLGYNAYSILETGKDEYGQLLPLSIRSFGDYKPPLYVYLDVLPIKLFGLTPFAVRFPSALLGSLSIIFVFLLVYELFRKEKYRWHLAFFTTLFFSFSPWSIQFSRIAFEANVGLFFVILGAWIFIKGLHTHRNIFFFLSVLSFALSIYSYHSEKLFSPLLLLGLVISAKDFFLKRKLLLVGIFTFFLLLNVPWLTMQGATQRGQGVLFTSQQLQLLQTVNKQIEEDQVHNDSLNTLVHNRRLVFINTFAKSYLSHFDPNFLFITGDNARHHAPGVGVLYLTCFPLIIVGMFFLIRKRVSNAFVVFYWFLIAPIASALAIDAPSAVRSLVFLPIWHLFEAAGLTYLFASNLNRRIVRFGFYLFLFLFVGNVFYFLHQYFVHTNTDNGQYWQYGYKEAISELQNEKDKKIFFANDIEQGYAFYLFYNTYDPSVYIKEGGSERRKDPCFSIANAYFGECREKMEKKDYYITGKTPSDSDRYKEIKNFNYLNGEKAITIYTIQ